MNQSETTSVASARRVDLMVVAFLTVLASLALKLVTGGWGLLLWGPLYLAAVCPHLVVHVIHASRSSVRPTPSRALLSNGLLLLAFLLQTDFGDGPSGWIAIAVLPCIVGMGSCPSVPDWWPVELVNVGAFAPVAATWLWLLASKRTPSSSSASDRPPTPLVDTARRIPASRGFMARVGKVRATLLVVAAVGVVGMLRTFVPDTLSENQHRLRDAAGAGDIAEVERLLALGERLREPYPMQAAVLNRQYDMVRYLVANGAPIDGDGELEAPLWYAVTHGDLRMAELLIELGANVNWQANQGGTPLHAVASSPAIRDDRLQLAQLLFAHKADVNVRLKGARDEDGCRTTPLHAAVSAVQEPVVELFLAHGADPGSVDRRVPAAAQCARDLLQQVHADLRPQVERIIEHLTAAPDPRPSAR